MAWAPYGDERPETVGSLQCVSAYALGGAACWFLVVAVRRVGRCGAACAGRLGDGRDCSPGDPSLDSCRLINRLPPCVVEVVLRPVPVA